MCKFESSQKDESRWQLTDSSKAYRNTSAFKCIFCIHHLTFGYIFMRNCQLKIFWRMCCQKFHLGSCRYSAKCISALGFLCANNSKQGSTTHALNVSAHLLWMDFTVCSMIHFSCSMANFISMNSNSHNHEIIHATLCSLACTAYVYWSVCHTCMTFRHVNQTVQWFQSQLLIFAYCRLTYTSRKSVFSTPILGVKMIP